MNKYRLIALFLLIMSYGVVSAPLVTFSLQNKNLYGSTYYADLYANVRSGSSWQVSYFTLVVQYNSAAMNLNIFNGSNILNVDSDITAANGAVYQTANGSDRLNFNLFVLSPVNKTGTFRVGTIRWSVHDAANYDNLTFDEADSDFEVFNGSTLLNYCSDGTTCYSTDDGAAMMLSNIRITTIPFDKTIFCAGEVFNVAYSVNGGVLNSDNVYRVQLSDASGSFTNPSTIGTYQSNLVNGMIMSTLPATLSPGSGYRIRVISTNTPIYGSNNGTDLSIHSSKNLSFTLGLEGLWNSSLGEHQFGFVSIELRQGTSLINSNLVTRQGAFINSNGTVNSDFCVPSGNYYIVLRTQGYLPLAVPQLVSLNDSFSWNFTSSQNQAVGGEIAMVLESNSGRWLARSGDINNTRSVTALDAYLFQNNYGRSVSRLVPFP